MNIDQTYVGVVGSILKEIGASLSTFKLFATGAVMHNHNDSRWHFTTPILVSIHLRDNVKLTPEQIYALSHEGTAVKVRVTGDPDFLEAEMVSVTGRTRCTLQELAMSLEESMPKTEGNIELEINGDLHYHKVCVVQD